MLLDSLNTVGDKPSVLEGFTGTQLNKLRKKIIMCDKRQNRKETAEELDVSLSELTEIAFYLNIPRARAEHISYKYSRSEWRELFNQYTREELAMMFNVSMYTLRQIATELGM